MSSVTVSPVRTSRDRGQFQRFPFAIYRGNALWAPPILREEEGLLGYRPHPYHAENEVQTFLARRGNEVVGRIAAIHDRSHNAQFNDNTGFVGFFECRDDLDAARSLFETAAQWHRARGLTRLRGPMNPSLHYTVGVLVEGFDQAPMFMMPYNLDYYPRLFEACGFRKVQDLYAYGGRSDQLPEVDEKFTRYSEQITKWFDIRFRPLNPRHLTRDVVEFLEVINRSLMGHWGYAPISEAEIVHAAKGLAWLLEPSITMGAEIDGKLVGVMFVMPDYNDCLRQSGGRLFPLGLLRMLWNKRRIRKFRVIGTNVVPEFHMKGVAMALATAVFRNTQKWITGEEVEFSWIAESNEASVGAVEKGGAKRTKTYRVYDRDATLATPPN